jgi:hypothetical protein
VRNLSFPNKMHVSRIANFGVKRLILIVFKEKNNCKVHGFLRRNL